MSELFSGLANGFASPAGLIFSSLVLLAIGLLITRGVKALVARRADCASRTAPGAPEGHAQEERYRRAA